MATPKIDARFPDVIPIGGRGISMSDSMNLDYKELRDRILLMGGEVESAIDRAMRALTERDSKLAAEVLMDDDRIDASELKIDRLCIDLLRQKTPDDRGLRFILTAAKMTPILERIADHACNIARLA